MRGFTRSRAFTAGIHHALHADRTLRPATDAAPVLFAQDCYGWGSKSVDILLHKIVNNQAPPQVKVVDQLALVTKENADEYAKNWSKWLGK
ncbi:MAG: hypothetical protein ABI839_08215 [Verrucomicrobiota bacterium]